MIGWGGRLAAVRDINCTFLPSVSGITSEGAAALPTPAMCCVSLAVGEPGFCGELHGAAEFGMFVWAVRRWCGPACGIPLNSDVQG